MTAQPSGEPPTPSPRDRWALIGFGVPMAIVVAFSLYLVISIQAQASTSGYEGLGFIFLMIVAIPAMLLWAGIGALVAKRLGPAGSAKRFGVGALAALGASIIVLTITCFLALA